MTALTPEKLAKITEAAADAAEPGEELAWHLTAEDVLALIAEIERLQAELKTETQFNMGIRLDVEKVLDKALGPNEEDGAGGGLAADVTLLADRLVAANAEVERLQKALSDRGSMWADVHDTLAEHRRSGMTDNELTNAVMALVFRDAPLTSDQPGGSR